MYWSFVLNDKRWGHENCEEMHTIQDVSSIKKTKDFEVKPERFAPECLFCHRYFTPDGDPGID